MDQEISQLLEKNAVGLSDWIPIVDESETIPATKKISSLNLLQQINVRMYGAVGDGVTDDTTAINLALSSIMSSGGAVIFPRGYNFLISQPLKIYSNTLLDARGATITEKAGSNCNMLINSAQTANRTVSDAVTVNGSATVTSATANFTSADIGASLVISGGMTSGDTLVGTVVTVNSTTSVTLNNASNRSASSLTCSIYYPNINIEIMGGIWDRGANTLPSTNPLGFTMTMYHVNNLYVHDLQMKCTDKGYNTLFADITNFTVKNITLNCGTTLNTDGVHILGPATQGYIENIQGTTGDDMVVFSPSDLSLTGLSMGGNVTNIVVNGIFPNGSLSGGKIYGSNNFYSKAIYIKNIVGTTTQNGFDIWDNGGTCNFDDIIIENVNVQTGNGNDLINIAATSGGKLTLKNLTNTSASLAGNVVSFITGNGNSNQSFCENLTIDGVNIEATSALAYIVRFVNGYVNSISISNVFIQAAAITGISGGASTIKNMIINNWQWFDNNGDYHAIVDNGGTINFLQFNNIYINGGGKFLAMEGGSGATQIMATNIVLDGAQEGIYQNSSNSVNITINNLVLSTLANNAVFNLQGSGGLTVYGKGMINTNNLAAFQRSGTQTPRFIHPDMQVDLTTISKTNGDIAYNTNATAGSTSIGLGPAISDGSHWKNLYSGNIY